jgi:Glycosyl hydrolases family 16
MAILDAAEPTTGAEPRPTSTPIPAPNPVPPSSGSSMPTGDLPGWTLVFNDDFDTPVALGDFPAAVADKWGAYPAGWADTSRHGVYSPDIVSISDSMMDVWVHTENGVHKVAAPVPRVPGGDQLYGRYAIRFRADAMPGYKAAWLLWPQSEVWPRDGEIDFPEGNFDRHISAFLHHQGATSGSDQDAFDTSTTFTSWHTAVVEWGPSQTRFILDDTVIGTSTSRIPNTPMHWVIQTETALDGSVPDPGVSGHVQIDWVAVWSYTP